MKKIAILNLIFLVLLGLNKSYAQEEVKTVKTFKTKVFNTDRGTFTRSARTIGTGLQLEAGTNYEVTQTTNPAFRTTTFSPFQGQLRVGIAERVEFNFAIANNELVNRNWDESATDKYNYWTPLEIGLRVQLIKRQKTDFSIFANFRAISTQREAVDEDGNERPWVLADRPNYVGPEFAFLGQHYIGQRIVLSYNGGIRWTGIQLDVIDSNTAKRPDVYYIVRALFHFAESVDFYVEHFNFMRSNFYSTTGLNGGFRFALTRGILFDINGGFGFNDFSPVAFAGAGLSFNLGN